MYLTSFLSYIQFTFIFTLSFPALLRSSDYLCFILSPSHRTIDPPHHWLNSLLTQRTIDSNRALFHWSWINLSLVASNPWFIDPQHHKFNWLLLHDLTFVSLFLSHWFIDWLRIDLLHRVACRLLLISKIHCFRLILFHRVRMIGSLDHCAIDMRSNRFFCTSAPTRDPLTN